MGSSLRVLHVVVNMNRGGAETLLMNLYRNMDRSKVQFDFLTCKEGVFDEEIIELGGRVHRIPYVTDVGHRGYINALNNFFFKHTEYKIVHSHMDKMSGYVLRAAKRSGVPIRIAHSHNTSSEGNLPAKLYKWYAGKHILSTATHLFACSNSAAKWLFKSRVDKAKILKNGVEIEKFTFSSKVGSEVREELGIDDDSLVIGHIGRFNHQKNHSYLIDVFYHVAEKQKNAKLILVGDGTLRNEIEEKIKKYNLTDKVLLLGVRSDISRLLQCFDLFVFPSIHEGLPVTLIEAQAAGIPCIISDAITKEVDMGSGLVSFLPLSEVEAWVQKITSLSSFRKKVEYAETLAKHGYDIKQTALWTEGFYLAI